MVGLEYAKKPVYDISDMVGTCSGLHFYMVINNKNYTVSYVRVQNNKRGQVSVCLLYTHRFIMPVSFRLPL